MGLPSVRRRRLLLVAYVLTVLLVGLLVLRQGERLFLRSFDARRWAAPELEVDAREERRWSMAEDLVRNHLRTGMTQPEVLALLGPADPDPFLAQPREGDWLYTIGPTPPEKLRLILWALWPRGTDLDDMGSFSELTTFRALVLGFDALGRLERFEVIER